MNLKHFGRSGTSTVLTHRHYLIRWLYFFQPCLPGYHKAQMSHLWEIFWTSALFTEIMHLKLWCSQLCLHRMEWGDVFWQVETFMGRKLKVLSSYLGRNGHSKSQGLGIHTRLGFFNTVSHSIGWLKPFVISSSPPWLLSPSTMAWYHLGYAGTATRELDLGALLSLKTNPGKPVAFFAGFGLY